MNKRIIIFIAGLLALAGIFLILRISRQPLAVSGQSAQASSRARSDPSRTESISYQTSYHGKAYRKHALVYLPTGYNRRRRYNTIYLVHGSTESSRDFYRDGNFKQVLDRLISQGKLKPSIVVFPTYYPDRSFVTNDYYQDKRLNKAFAKDELVKHLVPAVEGRYHTYAKGTSRKQLRASRSHRAFGGFSVGAITSWYVFEYQLPYFRSFLPVAGDSWTVENDGGAAAPKQTAARLAKAVRKAGSPSFKILAAVGSNDGTSASMSPQIRAMHENKVFSRYNLRYYKVPGGSHSPQTTARAFRHFAPQLFAR